MNKAIPWIIGSVVILVIALMISVHILPRTQNSSVVEVPTHFAPPSTTQSSVSTSAEIKTKHYANAFYEFDYPDNFELHSEHVFATHTIKMFGVRKVDVFGSTDITFKSTISSSSKAFYTFNLQSGVNRLNRVPEEYFQTASNRLNEFASPKDPNVLKDADDSYREIFVDGIRTARSYRLFNLNDQPDHPQMSISLYIPTKKMQYSLDMDGYQTYALKMVKNAESSDFIEAENFMTNLVNSFKIKEISQNDFERTMASTSPFQ